MESVKRELCDSLIQWFQILNLQAPHKNVNELSDGVAMAQALYQIAPDTFTETWLSKIKSDVGANWRLKVSNLKKVIEGVFDYYVDVLNLNLFNYSRPDAMKIAENADQIELGRLLQLILGCAVNCSQKQDYITQIMELEESLQQNIMQALQELEDVWQGATPSRHSLSMSTANDVKSLQDERDNLAQKCHEAERRITFLLEEKSSMQHEINKLQSELIKYDNPSKIGDDGSSIGPVQLGSNRYNELRKQMEELKDELLQAETSRDDYKMKSSQQEKEILSLQSKVEEFHQSSSELSQLKDEIDALKEASDKLKICETQVLTYKKKLEDFNDLKKQFKMLEERSAEYVRQNSQYEEDAKKYAGLKGQVELYKKEIQDLHAQLDAEMSKTMKIEFELNNQEAKMTALQREKETLLQERDLLRETCEELECNQVPREHGTLNTMSKELLSPALKDKIEQLEAENKVLREGQGGQTALAQLLDDSSQRTEKLREQLRVANQKILVLTQGQTNESGAKGDLVMQLRQALELNEQRASQIDELQSQISNLHSRTSQLEGSLSSREQELQAVENRSRKYIEKAKEVIKTLEPRISNDVGLLDKTTDGDVEPRTAMGLVEERLMASAFYRLSSNCQRDAVDARLALLSGPGQSFLGRQRQPAARKTINMSYKSK